MDNTRTRPYREITKKSLVVLGAGESGVGAALLGKQKGWTVFVSDFGTIPDHFKNELIEGGIEFEEGKHSEERIIEEAGLVVKSPGIPDKAPLIRKLTEKNIPIISEIEFGAAYSTSRIIAITGSNGKTTTTNLTYHLLKEAGFDVGIAGNIGFGFARLVSEKQPEWMVLELSSFQLDGIKKFRPYIGILLNITPDHLDRYEYEIGNYVNSKFRIIENQTENDHFIYNGNDLNINDWLKDKSILPKQYIIEMPPKVSDGKIQVANEKFEKQDLTIKGKHNLFNASCAIRVAFICGLKQKDIIKGLKTFVNDPHRLEKVAVVQGVEYINDSKATNVDAVYFALEAMEKPVIWIVGGVDKGNDYGVLEELVEKKVKAIICLGLENEKIHEAFSPLIKIIEDADNADKAVALAKIYATEGDAVLLSPACASFDLFENYKDRGEKFKAAVKSLSED